MSAGAVSAEQRRTGCSFGQQQQQQQQHIDKGKVADDIYRGMQQCVLPTIGRFVQAGRTLERSLAQCEDSGRAFFECVGRAGDCAISSAVSSDLADPLVDISDTHLALLDKAGRLRGAVVAVAELGEVWARAGSRVPLAAKQHQLAVKGKTERLNKAVKELHKVNQRPPRSARHAHRLAEALDAFKRAEADLRQYKQASCREAALEERRLLARFVHINASVTTSYVQFLREQLEALQPKAAEWTAVSEELTRKLAPEAPSEESERRGVDSSCSDLSNSSGSDTRDQSTVDVDETAVAADVPIHEIMPRIKVHLRKKKPDKKVKRKRSDLQIREFSTHPPPPPSEEQQETSGMRRRRGSRARSSFTRGQQKRASGGRHKNPVPFANTGDAVAAEKRRQATGGERVLLRAMCGHGAGDGIQLELAEGDTIEVLGWTPPSNGWQYGLNRSTGKQGWFPLSFTEPIAHRGKQQAVAAAAEHDYERISEYSGDSSLPRPDYPTPDYVQHTRRMHDGRSVTIQELQPSTPPPPSVPEAAGAGVQFALPKLRPAATNDRSQPLLP